MSRTVYSPPLSIDLINLGARRSATSDVELLDDFLPRCRGLRGWRPSLVNWFSTVQTVPERFGKRSLMKCVPATAISGIRTGAARFRLSFSSRPSRRSSRRERNATDRPSGVHPRGVARRPVTMTCSAPTPINRVDRSLAPRQRPRGHSFASRTSKRRRL